MASEGVVDGYMSCLEFRNKSRIPLLSGSTTFSGGFASV